MDLQNVIYGTHKTARQFCVTREINGFAVWELGKDKQGQTIVVLDEPICWSRTAESAVRRVERLTSGAEGISRAQGRGK